MSVLATWFTSTTIPGYLTAVIAAGVGLISYQNWRVLKAKLKLDLYDRRFAVYVAALDCYQDAFKTSLPQVEERIGLLIRATRESIFLFDPRDGIVVLLGDLREWCQNWSTIRKGEQEPESEQRSSERELSKSLRRSPANDVLRGELFVRELESRMVRYMSFREFK
jgi:hypothetical protein